MTPSKLLNPQEQKEFVDRICQNPEAVHQFLESMLGTASRDVLNSSERQAQQIELAKLILGAIDPVAQPMLDANKINPGHLVLALEFIQHEAAKQVLQKGVVEVRVEETSEGGDSGTQELVN